MRCKELAHLLHAYRISKLMHIYIYTLVYTSVVCFAPYPCATVRALHQDFIKSRPIYTICCCSLLSDTPRYVSSFDDVGAKLLGCKARIPWSGLRPKDTKAEVQGKGNCRGGLLPELLGFGQAHPCVKCSCRETLALGF